MVPKCPECGKDMKRDIVLDPSFSRIFQFINDTISRGGVPPMKYGCGNKIQNPKYEKWKKLKQKYDDEMKSYTKTVEQNNKIYNKKMRDYNNTLIMKYIKKPPAPPKNTEPPKPIPPEPPKMIPCKNHFTKKTEGEFNEKIKKKKRGNLYHPDGTLVTGIL